MYMYRYITYYVIGFVRLDGKRVRQIVVYSSVGGRDRLIVLIL